MNAPEPARPNPAEAEELLKKIERYVATCSAIVNMPSGLAMAAQTTAAIAGLRALLQQPPASNPLLPVVSRLGGMASSARNYDDHELRELLGRMSELAWSAVQKPPAISDLQVQRRPDDRPLEGLSLTVKFDGGAIMSIPAPRHDPGMGWLLSWGNPMPDRLTIASVVSSYQYLLSDGLTMTEAADRLRKLRKEYQLAMQTAPAAGSNSDG